MYKHHLACVLWKVYISPSIHVSICFTPEHIQLWCHHCLVCVCVRDVFENEVIAAFRSHTQWPVSGDHMVRYSHTNLAFHCVSAGAIHKHANKEGEREGEVRDDEPETLVCRAVWDPVPVSHAAGPQRWLHPGALWADAGETVDLALCVCARGGCHLKCLWIWMNKNTLQWHTLEF